MLHPALTYTNIVTLLLFNLLFGTAAPDKVHPLHVSTTEANLNAKTNSVEITCTLFTDDFENILKAKYKEKVDLISPAMHNKMDALVRSYIAAHLAWKLNDKAAAMDYVGFEIDKEAVLVYFEIPEVRGLSKVEASNTLLYDLFDDQMSIVHISNGKIRKSTKMLYPQNTCSVRF